MNRSLLPAALVLALGSSIPTIAGTRAFNAGSRPPFLDRRRILPVVGLDLDSSGGMREPWASWHELVRGVLSNDCVFEFPETKSSDSNPSGTYVFRWIDFFGKTDVPLTNTTVLARFSVDFDACTVEPLPSPAPLSDAEALGIVTNRFPDAVGVEGVPPLVQRVGGITIVGIPTPPDGRTDGRFYLYDPIVWIHDETKTVFEFCSQESDVPFPSPDGGPDRGQRELPSQHAIWDDRSNGTFYEDR